MTHRDGSNGQDREAPTPTCEGMADLPAPITEADEDN